MRRIILFFALALLGSAGAKAQFSALKINALGLAGGTINIAAEIAVSKQWSVELAGYFNPIENERFSARSWWVQPSVRYWFFEHFAGHFVAVHPAFGCYAVGNKKAVWHGSATGLGASYGYVWPLRKRLNLTAEAGVGLYYLTDKIRARNVDDWAPEIIINSKRIILAPSKLEISLSYLF